MFVIVSMEDKLRTSPEDFQRPSKEVLIEQIEKKYANKVIPDVGLFIKWLDFRSIGDPYVYPAEGAAHQITLFRMITFRPFIGEVLTGEIIKCSSEGVFVSLLFFEDILIPPHFLPQTTEFNASIASWIWRHESGDFEMSSGDAIRFKVKSILYSSPSQIIPGSVSSNGMGGCGDNEEGKEVLPPPAMQIIGDASELGLGNPVWW